MNALSHSSRAVFLFVITALTLLALPACSKFTGKEKADPNVDYYTCSMHPSVHSKDAGKCPICSMDLVPVMKKSANSPPPMGEHGHDHARMLAEQSSGGGRPNETQTARASEFIVPVERQQQIGVTYATVERRPLHHSIRSVGMVEPDLKRHWAFVARVEGYVQQLIVTSPGELVEKDQPLMSIYSPDLLTTEREFVSLLRMRDESRSKEARETPERLIAAAKFRLKQWNVTDEQIAELEKSRKPTEYLTLRSPFRGVVEEVPAHQGVSVKPGDHLVDVADLSIVWVWAEFYENELPMLERGQKTTVSAKSYPGETFEGEIALINPFIEELKRTARVRMDIKNPDFKLRPGMFVNTELAMDMGEALTVPVSAVMPTGTRNVVFVDKGEGRLEPRIVQLGAQFGNLYEVKSGLSEGERVVSSANFLIDAESKVQGALKDFGGDESRREESRKTE